MYKNIVPGLVSLDTKLTRMVGSYFIQNTGLYKDTDKKEKFHYRILIDSNFVMPSEYDFRSEYFFKKGKCWFYEKKFLFLTFKFKYDIGEKTFYFNKLFTLIPLKIGGLVPMLVYVSNFINMELFLNGFVNIRGFAFQYNKKNFCFIAPGFNGKTTFLSSMVEKGGKYISEDNLLINFLDMEVYPTSNSRMSKIYNRKTNKILEKQLNGNNIVTSKQKINKLYLVQNTKNMNYKTSSKILSEFLILNSLYFLTDNLFIKSFLFEENLINKFFKRLEEIKNINNYEFVQIKKYNYSSLINNLK